MKQVTGWSARLRCVAKSLFSGRSALIATLILILIALAMTACSPFSFNTTPTAIATPTVQGRGAGDPIWNTAGTGGSSSAIAWAESFQEGQPNAAANGRYNGMCLMFVANAYGAGGAGANTAWDLGSSLKLNDPSNPAVAPRGALMFFDLTRYGISDGHVGISLGGGAMISSHEHVPYVGVTQNIQTDTYWGPVYRGWAWPLARWGPLAAQAPTTANGGGNGSKGDNGVPPNSETAGGSAHTWTDYVHAGGTQGPSVAVYQTIQVACKLTGFKVADGNTWWYRIASSPWNNKYYVSADAFYNSGQTSGSLHNTPFMDPNVPTCAGSAPPTTPPTVTPVPKTPPTVTPVPSHPQPTPTPVPPLPNPLETAGGVAHTWTNYTNAGGTEGPSVAAYQTIQIACKRTGFQVADGNTWWYRIAQSPWNNAYYVSADAFYNNGATSGSLHGTPFVDNNVPNC